MILHANDFDRRYKHVCQFLTWKGMKFGENLYYK
jgi:hypothetical protein